MINTDPLSLGGRASGSLIALSCSPRLITDIIDANTPWSNGRLEWRLMQEDISVWSQEREAGRDKAALEPDPPELITVWRLQHTVQLVSMKMELLQSLFKTCAFCDDLSSATTINIPQSYCASIYIYICATIMTDSQCLLVDSSTSLPSLNLCGNVCWGLQVRMEAALSFVPSALTEKIQADQSVVR